MMLRNWTLAVAASCALVAACTSGTTNPSNGGAQGPGGSPDGGSNGSGGTDATGGGGSGSGPELPAGTLLYVRAVTPDQDVLVARDLESGDERIVTDLTGDGSSGWNLNSYSLSPDRRRIAIASLYGPTSEDTATGLATRAIWTLATDGTDFRRLTPTFPNTGGGRQNFQIDVGDPTWTSDGAYVLFDVGNYWWEGNKLAGGTFPWLVAGTGDEIPSQWLTTAACSVIHPSRNPATGEMLLIHSVCIPGSGEDGLYLYPEEGSKDPQKLLASSHVSGGVDVFLAAPTWISDGSGFLFIGSTEATDWSPGILIYNMAKGTATPLVAPPPDAGVSGVTISPDGSKIVYALRKDEDGSQDLHLIDISTSKPTDTPLTNDGKSRLPSF